MTGPDAHQELVDPHALPFLLGLCDAIEAFTGARVARDPQAFRPNGVELRYAIERHLYFLMVNNAELHRLFVAARTSQKLPARLPLLTEQFAPFLVKGWKPRGHWRRLEWRTPGWRRQRQAFRTLGAANIAWGDRPDGEAPILFHMVQAKFLPFLRPIAQALGRPYAFLVFEDPDLFAQLEGLPRLHITLEEPSRALLRDERFGLLEYYSTYLNAIMAALADVRPGCIVVPEGNAPHNELFNRAGHAAGIPSLCIQQGWSPIVHAGFRNMSYDRMCVWGKGFAQALAPYNPEQNFVVTGSHVIAPHPRRGAQAGGPIAFFLQTGGSPLITRAAADAMLDFALWTARQFPQREIRVRPHPGAPLSSGDLARLAGSPNLRMMPAGATTLEDVLNGSDVAVSIFSTTILEAAAAGVIPLIVNVAGLPHYNPDIAREGAAIEVTDFDAARRVMTRLLQDDAFAQGIAGALAAVSARYFAPEGPVPRPRLRPKFVRLPTVRAAERPCPRKLTKTATER